jgi:EPS-associated MarR family transcriptional regulator
MKSQLGAAHHSAGSQDTHAQAYAPEIMTSRQAQIQEDTYYRIMRTLEDKPDLSQRDLAERVGISLGGLNYCLKALMEKGFVKLDNFQNSKHKFKYVYVLTPAGVTQKMAMTGRFLRRKLKEYEALESEIAALKAEMGVVAGRTNTGKLAAQGEAH